MSATTIYIPVCPESDLARSLIFGGEGVPALLPKLLQAASLTGAERVVTSPLDEVLTFAAAQGCTTFRLNQEPTCDENSWLPPGADLLVADSCMSGIDTPCLVADYRNPWLSGSMLDQGITGLDRGAAVVFSVFISRDHPVQWERYLRILHMEWLLLLDPNFPTLRFRGEQLAASHPFPFEWAYFSVKNLPGLDLFAVVSPGVAADAELLPVSLLPPNQTPKALLFFVKPDLARVIALHEWLGALPGGMESLSPFSYHGVGNVALVGRHGQKSGIAVVDWPGVGEFLRITPVLKGKPQHNLRTVLPACDLSEPFPMPKDLCDYTAFIVERLAEAGPPVVDSVEPLLLKSGDFSYDLVNGTMVAGDDGKPIHGRQAFPPVYQVEGSLVGCAKLRDLDRVSKLAREGPAVGVPLPHQEAKRICRPFDLLHYQAWSQEGEGRT